MHFFRFFVCQVDSLPQLPSLPRSHELLKPRGKSQNRIVGAPAGRRGAGSSYSTIATIAQEMGVSQLYSGEEVFKQQFFLSNFGKS